MRRQLLVSIVATVLLTSCTTLGPNYQRPAIPAPSSFRAPELPPITDAASLGDLKWFEVFKDEKLQELVRAALVQNYDLRQAAARVEAANANLGITRSNQVPNMGASASLGVSRFSAQGANVALSFLSYELDFWGRLRRATEASRADLLSAEESRKAVMATLVSQVASNYFSLRELDYQLEISQRTLATRKDSLGLIQNRQAGGIATLLDLRQSEQLVYSAAATIPVLQQGIEQTENQISLLLGKNPGDVLRGQSLTEQQMPPEVPAGLPSALLERRPDIRAAEQDLIAANAEIGIAKAAYFPQISLTAFLGGQGNQLRTLFSGPNAGWNFVPQVTQPIFTAGRLKSQVKLSEAVREGALIQYEKTIQTAFTEVSDALIAHERVRESRVQQEFLVAALQDRTRLAYVRYRGGVDTLLNALDSDRDLFQAELLLSRVRLDELNSVVQLYKALGGGWQ